MIPTLKVNDKAYFDSIIGLIKCKVLSLTPPKDANFKLFLGNQDISAMAKIKLLETVKGYKEGEILDVITAHVVPMKAIKKGEFFWKIIPYEVEYEKLHL